MPESAEDRFFLLRNITLLYTEKEAALQLKVAELFSLDASDISALRIVRKGIDARKKPRIKYVYTVEFTVSDPDRFGFVISDEEHRCTVPTGNPDLERVGVRDPFPDIRDQVPVIPP